MRAYLPVNHLKASGTTQLSITRTIPMETVPSSPGMRTMDPLDHQTTSPTTASLLPPATMTSPTACRPMTLQRKSSARTTDDFGYTPAPPKGKGKAKAPARARIESDDDDEDDDDGRAEDAAARGPRLVRPVPGAECRDQSRPVVLHPPSVAAQTVKSGVNNFAPAPVLSDEEQVEVRSPVKPLRKPVQLVPDSSPLTDGTPKEPAAPTPAALKDAQHEYPPQPKFNPQLKVPAQFAAAPASTTSSAPAPAQAPAKAAPPFDKILITIRHPPTEKENKFKVKSTHLVGRVLTSACSAFGLNPTGATLMAWAEEDGLEMTSPCTNDVSMGTVATDGAVFIIELAK
ncbi:hypothetical protein EDB89DRAFT_2067651 [Lactarius sanguifluus]|nr:hypothetical protein EDB89DRAFT_2067651 [Lactarius sanguifluus]